ncbi:UDP-N-acetylmuramoyl-L-alanyl-D-glutamate--2,6-diaminopimelate ligase [Pedobacter sp. HMF7647]|uniref:UDP-N-acetylmuramoyl-L-alanyl-D-glutamate--2,6-diaminopimelate ligase n=1 Tax=Hufsiella arboris TaxID=2695275 RepID=A0A7K1YDW5_9SPHI|nr:UDP-N-acetylmuramoyl-L-alanyl-D-glutamate--2,6-diaminopimelate ligase [Hufsiella arboris]MXV52772.1 UDP-N-acetylmuramoyl-L-alanyl-D-glutamate--2,6-diaminopimelate ligase [Hufsiella arboris]
MKLLKDILFGVNVLEILGPESAEISEIIFDSRKATHGVLFVAVRGTVTDGHQYIGQVINEGVKAIVCESAPGDIQPEITYVLVSNSAKALGVMASNFYDQPSAKLKLVGVTGTNGKTTIATLLYKLFIELGYKTGLLSTVENQINGVIIPSTHTTPDQIALNALLHDMVTAGCDYCFMEVSSHAVAQSRIEGLYFTGAVFSNLTHDHLDFHKTFSEYLKAKKAFFDGLDRSAFALTNADDKNGAVMLQNTRAHKKTYGLKNLADFKGKLVENHFSGLLLNIDGEEVWFKLVGSFNAYNLLAVYGASMLLEQDRNKVLTILSRLSGAEGRFDYVSSGSGIIGIVDYAHTPDAVQNVLSTIHDIRKGNEQLITIIGCGGDRDKTKRPVMAQTACDWSDKVILTSDNPRTEDPEAILADMEEGVTPNNKRKVLHITDRKEAIRTAVHLAKPGDIILLAGKGHEKYQEIKGVKHPFDDKKILSEQLNLITHQEN